jgi:hypothetical protein
MVGARINCPCRMVLQLVNVGATAGGTAGMEGKFGACSAACIRSSRPTRTAGIGADPGDHGKHPGAEKFGDFAEGE